jgi:hypothetical protein
MKRGSCASSAGQPVVPRRDCKQLVAYVDCCNYEGTQEEIQNDVFMAASDAVSIGCSAIFISLDPTMESVGFFPDVQVPFNLREKTFKCHAVDHVIMLYDCNALRLVACERFDPEGGMPALCATLEPGGSVSSVAQPAPYTLLLLVCSLPHNMPRKAKMRVVGQYLYECEKLAGEQENSAKKTFVVIGGNFGGLDAVRCSALAHHHQVVHREAYVVSECDGLYALCWAEGAAEPRMVHCNRPDRPALCYWCDDLVVNAYNSVWIGAPLCDLCQDWHLGHGPFREEADRIRARGAEWDGGPYSPTAADRCAVLLSRWFRARMLPDEPVCGLIADFLVPWYEP